MALKNTKKKKPQKIVLKEIVEVPGTGITFKNSRKIATAACGCYKNQNSCSPCGC